MAETFVNVTEGAGKKLHAFDKTIGANVVLDEVNVLGEPYLASYTVTRTVAASAATANDHWLQVMAGASLNLYIRRILLYQAALATTAAFGQVAIFRLTTAGTGGTALTPAGLDPGDAAAGATAMMTPTAKGTEGGLIWVGAVGWTQTVATQTRDPLLLDLRFGLPGGHEKSLKIGSGTTNGIAIKGISAIAAASVYVNVWFQEANF